MKFYITLISFLALSMTSYSQKNLVLNIQHMLGDQDFAYGIEAENNLNQSYKVDRLAYYLSQLVLIHDGGQETLIEDLWILVEANKISIYELGSFDITDLESIRFSVGVEEEVNHDDPALWPMDHPLAPKNPSMHWGWTGGYRFVALEGNAGATFNTNFEMHGLGDVNYFEIALDLDEEVNGDQMDLYVRADYNKALEDINVNAGPLSHGEGNEAKKVLENFRDLVFTPGAMISSTENNLSTSDFSLFPNPSSDGLINIQADLTNYNVDVTDIAGRTVSSAVSQNGKVQFQINTPGVYLVSLYNEAGFIGTERVVVK